jgi:hypothetical protein
MTIEWARKELKIRCQEDRDAEEDGTWEAFAAMKRRRSYRRKDMGYSRTKARAWLELAELEIENTTGNPTPKPATNMRSA